MWASRTQLLDQARLLEAVRSQRATTRFLEPKVSQILQRYAELSGEALRPPGKDRKEEAAEHARAVEHDTELALTFLGECPAQLIDDALPKFEQLHGRDSAPVQLWTINRRRMLVAHLALYCPDYLPRETGPLVKWWQHQRECAARARKEIPIPSPKPPPKMSRRSSTRPQMGGESPCTSLGGERNGESSDIVKKLQRMNHAAAAARAAMSSCSISALLHSVTDAAANGDLPAWMMED